MSAYSDLVIAHGASHYWRLGEPSGTTAVDVVGGANGTISGGVTLNQPGAIADGNTAMAFDGVFGAKISTASTVTLGYPFTLEAWVRGSDASPNRPMLHWPNNSPIFFLNGGRAELYHALGGGGQGLTVMSSNAWHHVVCTQDAATLTLYIDGIVDRSVASAFVNGPAVRVDIGYSDDNGTSFLGAIDDVAIYPRVLTPAEILAHVAAASPARRSDVALWALVTGGDALQQFNRWFPLTPSDTIDIATGPSDALWIGGAGDISALMQDGTVGVITAVPAGAWLPIATRRVRATGTTATNLLVLYQV